MSSPRRVKSGRRRRSFGGEWSRGVSPLTKHDERLLELISHGVSDERIGEQLQLSAEAVQASVRRVVLTMGARNRTHAVALALKTGLIE